MKKSLKILTVILLAIMMITISTNVFADNLIDPTAIHEEYVGSETISSAAGKIMGIIKNVAIVIAVIALMIIGIKYMMGSVEEKAEYKKTLIPLAIGIVVVAGAATIVSWLMNSNIFG